MTDRRTTLLLELVELRRPLPAVLEDLSALPWDCDEDLVTLTTAHVVAILQRYKLGNLAATDVEGWADAVEMRDGISFDPEGAVAKVIHELANPLITRPLSLQSASQLVAGLNGTAT